MISETVIHSFNKIFVKVLLFTRHCSGQGETVVNSTKPLVPWCLHSVFIFCYCTSSGGLCAMSWFYRLIFWGNQISCYVLPINTKKRQYLLLGFCKREKDIKCKTYKSSTGDDSVGVYIAKISFFNVYLVKSDS